MEEIIFDKETLVIKIDTRGKGINTIDGYKQWETRLRALDRSGEEAEIGIRFWLQRTVSGPSAELALSENKVLDEGEKIKIEELITIESIHYPDHIINLSIIHENRMTKSNI